MITATDLKQLSRLGITPEQVQQQLKNFRKGFPFLSIVAPATLQRGIIQLNKARQEELIACYEKWNGSRLKFIPASGLATRMFKSLYETQAVLAGNPKATIDNDDSAEFFDRLADFAFYDDLKSMKRVKLKDKLSILDGLLGGEGLNYGNLPKGLLKFHKYREGARTALEEHLVEAALYAKDTDNVVRLHFTVSPEHYSGFKKLLKKVQKDYEKRFEVQFEISFSEQKKFTNTIVADEENQPFRDTDGNLLFRPGGHGALLENLNDIQEDIVFIKNIDNVAPEAYKEETVKWKKILAGMLLQLQKQVATYIAAMESGEASVDFYQIGQFLETNFCVIPPHIFDSEDEYETWLYKKLNRPLRICGVVQNLGEAGGAPVVVKSKDGSQSLQIAESMQFNMKKDMKKFTTATHFNPVDLVCSFRDYKGGKFDLWQFCNPATGFISTRDIAGKRCKIQELPGLWNGAMSDWNTMFVEVPLITFNPVKTVNDLLRKEHQG